MKHVVGRFIGGPADKLVRALDHYYATYRFPVMRPVSLHASPEVETITCKVAEYICLEDVNELGQHIFLYVGTK